jgi:hypothetical protein
VSKPTVADIESNLAPDPMQILRREMAATVAAANDSFKEYRLASLPTRPINHRARAGIASRSLIIKTGEAGCERRAS